MTSICMITLTILFICLLQISPIQSVHCYTCIDCGDPFNANSSNVSRSPSSCYYCYKLTVFMAYSPSRYIVKECVQSCTESSGLFGGSSLEVNCCSTSLCNKASGMYCTNRFIFTIVSSLFITLLIGNIRQ